MTRAQSETDHVRKALADDLALLKESLAESEKRVKTMQAGMAQVPCHKKYIQDLNLLSSSPCMSCKESCSVAN